MRAGWIVYTSSWASWMLHLGLWSPLHPAPVPTWVLACCNCCQCEKEKEPTMSKHKRVFHIWDFVPGPPTDKLAPTKVLPTEESIWYPGQCHQCSIRHRTQKCGWNDNDPVTHVTLPKGHTWGREAVADQRRSRVAELFWRERAT